MVLFRKSSLELLEKGKRLREQGKSKEALKYANKALETDPMNDEAIYLKGVVYFDMGLNDDSKYYDEALKYLDKALQLNPSNSNVYYVKGTVFYYQRSFEKAVKCLEKYVALEPSSIYVPAAKDLLNRMNG